jgi:predicted regulator of Ras-like GTPase activity (Roadblock/LC7/MglB family)
VLALPAMEAAQALADLTEISAQIEAAVLASTDGTVIASTFADDAKAEPFAAAASELMRSADEAARDSVSSELVQVQAATPQGSVFVVRDGDHLVAAVTGAQPTVGLVFYDLKTCLRLVEREEKEAGPASRKRAKKDADGGS